MGFCLAVQAAVCVIRLRVDETIGAGGGGWEQPAGKLPSRTVTAGLDGGGGLWECVK